MRNLEMACDFAGKLLTEKQILEIYAMAVKDGNMKENCYINSHEAIINYGLRALGVVGKKVIYRGCLYMANGYKILTDKGSWGKSSGRYTTFQFEIEGHDSTHFIGPEYNPDPSLKLQRLISTRFFDIVEV